MEVSRRPVPRPRRLTAAVGEGAGSLAAPAVALGTVGLLSLLIVTAQPLGSPWWTYADADATYLGAGLNVLAGAPATYLDHPGLPLELLLAVVFGVGELYRLLTGGSTGMAYVDELLLDPGRTVPVFRGLAALVYVGGALATTYGLARLLRGWGWGLAGGLLWLAAPGLVPMAIQYRPDVALAALAAVFAIALGRAIELRSAGLYLATGAVAGLAVMVKLHATGLIVPLALAVVWRPPADGWWPALRARTGTRLRRHRVLAALVALAWLAAAVALNRRHLPYTPSAEQLTALLAPVAIVAAYLVLSVRLRTRWLPPFLGWAGAAVLAGLLLPVTLDVPDGLRALVHVANGLAGRGINEDVSRFGADLDVFSATPLPLFLALAAVAAVLGVVRRDPRPVAWFAGAAALAAMAQARPPVAHYFAPAFVLTIPAVLWLLASARNRVLGAAVTALLVAVTVAPALEDRDDPARETEAFARSAEPALAAAASRLRPGEVVLVPSNWPTGDSRWFEWLENVVAYTPEYPYRFLPATAAAVAEAEARGLRLRYAAGFPEPENGLGAAGSYRTRPVPGADGVVELLAGPGT